jgi:hypothetical protein
VAQTSVETIRPGSLGRLRVGAPPENRPTT